MSSWKEACIPSVRVISDTESRRDSHEDLRSQRSKTIAAAEARLAEIKKEQRLAALKLIQLDSETEKVRKQLAIDLADIDDQLNQNKIYNSQDDIIETIAEAIQSMLSERTYYYPKSEEVVPKLSRSELIHRAYEELRKLPKPTTYGRDLNMLAVRVENIVYLLKSTGHKSDLYDHMLKVRVLEKLEPFMHFRWYDYASVHEGTDDPEFIILSHYLRRDADLAMKYGYVTSKDRGRKKRNKH